MISHISGRLKLKRNSSVVIEVHGLSYEVLIPAAIITSLDPHVDPNGNITLVTYHYYQIDPSKSIPVLIGFLNEIEKEFFEHFITVSGVGPKSAVRALNRPISEIAGAIDRGDHAFLKSLPGIGQQRAREIIAKLQGRVAKFGLIQDRARPEAAKSISDIEKEALEVLLQLQYKRHEAERMLKEAKERNSAIATTEELLSEVYRHKVTKPVPA